MNRRNWMEREKGGVNEQEQDGNGEGGEKMNWNRMERMPDQTLVFTLH